MESLIISWSSMFSKLNPVVRFNQNDDQKKILMVFLIKAQAAQSLKGRLMARAKSHSIFGSKSASTEQTFTSRDGAYWSGVHHK